LKKSRRKGENVMTVKFVMPMGRPGQGAVLVTGDIHGLGVGLRRSGGMQGQSGFNENRPAGKGRGRDRENDRRGGETEHVERKFFQQR